MTAVAWSGLFDHVGGSPHSLINGNTKSSHMRRITRLVRSGPGAKQLKEALADEGAGTAYTAQAVRVVAPPDVQDDIVSMGGLRTVETQDLKTTTLTTALDNAVDGKFTPTTYPTDLSGNGGGGKLGL